MLNNNKRAAGGGEKVTSRLSGEKKLFLCRMCYNEHWPTTTTASRPSDMRTTATTWQIFILPIFISFMPLPELLVHISPLPLLGWKKTKKNSPPHTKQEPTDWQDTQSSDYLIFRKRSQEILIGILCICFEASAPSRRVSEWEKERERESEIV